MRNLIATLELNCWSFALGGEHYFGRIHFYDNKGEYQREEILHPLSIKEATYLNKKNKTRSICLYKPGDMSPSFETKDEVIKYAIKMFREICPHCRVLNRGSFACADPQEVLIGPKWFKDQTNKLVAKKEAVGGYERNTEVCEEIFGQYCELIAKLHKY